MTTKATEYQSRSDVSASSCSELKGAILSYIYIYVYIYIYIEREREYLSLSLSLSLHICIYIYIYRRRKLFCIESALHTPCIPVSMLALDFAAGGVMNIHVEDGVSERTQP